MAKKQIKKYYFTPGGAGVANIVVPGKHTLEKLLLVVNVTRGVIYFNFADVANTPVTVSFKPGYVPTNASDTTVVTYGKDIFGNDGTALIQSSVSGIGETTFTLQSALADGHSADDSLSILVEEQYQMVRPWNDFGTDAIERTRIAAPQALIDADFEYGLQPTKWQGYELVNKVPSIYELVAPDLIIGNVVTQGNAISLITVFSVAHGFNAGSPVTVQQLDINTTGYSRAQGSFLVFSANANFFTYFAKGQVGSTVTSIDTPRTSVRRAGIYSGASLPITWVDTDKGNPSKLVLTFATPHGMTPGFPLVINNNPNWGGNITTQTLSGSYFANVINDPYRITIQARGQINPTVSSTNLTSLIITGSSGTLQAEAPQTTLYAGMPLKISGTPTGTGTFGGYIAGTTYYLIGTPVTQLYAPTTLSTVVIAGVAGQFTCAAPANSILYIGQRLTISGTLGGTGTITGYTNPKDYYIIATNGSTTFTLSASFGGTAITTTAGTPTGLTYSLYGICSFTISASIGGSALATSAGTPTGLTYEMTSRASVWGAGGANIGNIYTTSTSLISVYARNDGFTMHRPGDGGVIFGTGSPIHGATTIRQSKKYFRYQSGKGMLYTTGVMFAPNYDIYSITAEDGNTTANGIIRIQTQVPHGLQIGATVRVRGVATAGYDGTFTVLTVEDDVTIRIAQNNGVGMASATGALTSLPKLFVTNWHGACIRTGPHDDANGMFFEYDGLSFNVCKRTSTSQIAGTHGFSPNSNFVNGTNSLYTQQLKIGDKLVLKGMVHRVTFINSDSQISVAPDFRGNVSISNNYVWRVDELRIQQKDFNMDTVDGSGDINNPSGYKMDPNHMQMVGIQFSWYGAGFMDFMVRGPDANFIILHRIKQNNVNPTASMRSANLPVRYEVNNEAANGVTSVSTAGSAVQPGDTTIAITDSTFFPSSGFVYIDNELIRYSGINTTNVPALLTGCTRQAVANVYIGGSYRQFQGANASVHNIGAGVELVSCTSTVNISHWGSSYIMDGGFDFDRGYSFNYTGNLSITSNTTACFGIRLAPSVSHGVIGDLGFRDLLNRAQILLQDISLNLPYQATGSTSVLANTHVLVQGILNPGNYYPGETWQALNQVALGSQPSFTQVAVAPTFTVAYDTNGNAIPGSPAGTITSGQFASGGEKLFEFVVTPGQEGKLSLLGVKELTQSAIGGTGTFPNGSDTLYINLRLSPNVAFPATTFLGNSVVTLRWAEAQA
jgi:hypothetical protein